MLIKIEGQDVLVPGEHLFLAECLYIVDDALGTLLVSRGQATKHIAREAEQPKKTNKTKATGSAA